MASFNFVDAAGKGYKFIWDERRALASIAAIPIIVKIISFNAAVIFGLQDNLLRQGLLFMPAYFLEGWLIAHCIRMAIFNELKLVPTSRLIMATTVSYLLMKLASSFLAGTVMNNGDPTAVQPAPSIAASLTVCVVLATVLWCFRFFWLYVPMAMGVPVTVMLKKIQSYGSSFFMLGLWLLVLAPMALITIGFADMLHSIFPDGVNGERAPVYIFLLASTQGVIETLMAIISSVGMAHGFKDILTGDNKTNKLF